MRNVLAMALAALLVLSAFAAYAWAEPAAQEPEEGASAATVNRLDAPESSQSATTTRENPLGGTPIDLGDGNYVNPQQLPDSSFIYDVTIADLANADSYLGGQTVQVVGEVIGDCINAEFDSEYCWIVLADSKDRTVSIFMPKSEKSKIDLFGRYGQTGTQLQVRGEFQLVCDEHQGMTDIHALHVSAVKEGELNPDQLNIESFIPGAAMVGLGLVLALVYWRLRERQR